MNETSQDILIGILSLKNFVEKLPPKCKVIVSNTIYQSDNGKASLTASQCIWSPGHFKYQRCRQ